ncbi:MAG: A24 family peptidase [Alphaproteobacteria bacterium]
MSEFWSVLAGGILGLVAAGAATHLGLRLADRMPGEKFWPECLYCQRPARSHEILPVFGWLLRPDAFRLPCPCGQQQKQWAVPAAEILGAVAAVTAAWIGGMHGSTLWMCLACGLLPAIAVVDLLFGIIPDVFNALLAVLGLGWLLSGGGELTVGLMLSGMMLLFGLFLAYGYSALRRKEMLGLGDVKFFAAAGLWLQPAVMPWFMVAAGLMGAVSGLFWKRMIGGEQSPFAPALCLSLLGCLLYQAR